MHNPFTKPFIILLLIIWAKFLAAQMLSYEGKNYLINGVNIPWNYFGSDVGTHYQWGALYDSAWFENTFADLESYGVNCVRFWIHCDGRTSPEFTDSGYVSGLDTNFFSNLDDIFLRAENHHIMLIPCLWSFDMTKDYRSSAGVYAGVHADLIRDTLKTKSYINNVLIPLVQHYANTCNLLAWEIINEPEWSMDIPGGGNTVQQVKDYEMQRFVAMQAEAIHQYSNKMVTLGSASIQWNSDTYTSATPVEGNYWSDSALQIAYTHSLAYLDFYQVHYYDWMHDAHFDPFDVSYPISYWNFDKPTIVGESGNSWAYSTEQMFQNAYSNKYAGVLFWSYAANDGYGSWDDCKNELLDFYNLHKDSILFTACDTTANIMQQKVIESYIKAYCNNGVMYVIYSNIQPPVLLELYDYTGRKIKMIPIKTFRGSEQIDISNHAKGLYFIRIAIKNKNQFVTLLVNY